MSPTNAFEGKHDVGSKLRNKYPFSTVRLGGAEFSDFSFVRLIVKQQRRIFRAMNLRSDCLLTKPGFIQKEDLQMPKR